MKMQELVNVETKLKEKTILQELENQHMLSIEK